MKTLIVQNFGPIVNSRKKPIEISPVTVFIGDQGTGKSTIAKLISEFTWLEKVLDRGDLQKKYVTQYNRFRTTYCAYHGIQNYFREDSFIFFEGDKFIFEYSDRHLSIEEKKEALYLRPQVMYIPAERNLVSALESADKIKRLPGALSTLMDEYNRALRGSKDGIIDLPLDQFSLQYDKLNKVVWLTGKGFRVRTYEAASGIQSIIPMSVVSNYLGNLVKDNSASGMTAKSSEERQRIEKTIQSILRDKSIDDEIRVALFRELSAGFSNNRFINVVEEPEQNLFPTSQRNVLFELLRIRNSVAENELVFTTHSPYIINYLSLAIKAAAIQDRVHLKGQKELEKIVPSQSRISGDNVAVYITSQDGSIYRLSSYEGMPSDENALNEKLSECNVLFERMLDLEEQNGL